MLAVRIVEEHLLEEVKIPGVSQLSGHLLALDIAQPHDLGHGSLDALDVFVDEVAQRPVRRFEFVFRVLDVEEVAVGHGDEEVEFRGVIVEDSGFGQPDTVGNQLQADALVVHRHEELKGMLQNLFPIGFHGRLFFDFKDTCYFGEKRRSRRFFLNVSIPISEYENQTSY